MDYRVQSVIVLLQVDLRRELSLDSLARLVNLSPSRFSHLFKAEAGISFARYLKSLRLQRAKDLLETTPLNIKEVMDKVGINDKSDFAKDFKKAFGSSPTEYRRSYVAPLMNLPYVVETALTFRRSGDAPMSPGA